MKELFVLRTFSQCFLYCVVGESGTSSREKESNQSGLRTKLIFLEINVQSCEIKLFAQRTSIIRNRFPYASVYSYNELHTYSISQSTLYIHRKTQTFQINGS